MKNNKTKTIIGLTAILVVFLAMACKEQPRTEPVEKEVIIYPASPVVIEKEAPKNSTTVTLDKNGLKVDAKKVNIKVEK